jgi:hypothetical protein
LSLQHSKWVKSQNGGQPKLAEWIPAAFDGDGGWRVEGRSELIDRERFVGNYKFVEENRRLNGD